MPQESSISWTQSTWNPTRGCRRVSPGCEQCYAEKIAHRFSGPGLPYEGLTVLGNKGPRWSGEARFVPDALDAPLRWRKPRKIFVDSMSDLFYEGFSDEEIAAVFGVMAACPQHTFQVLTKRPERSAKWFALVKRQAEACNAGRGMSMAAYCLAMAQKHASNPRIAWNVVDRTCGQSWPLRNVWIGVSVEDQERAEDRMPNLLSIPAVVRFVSYEPALELVDFQKWLDYRYYRKCSHCHGVGPDSTSCTLCGAHSLAWPAIDWIIIGGESGQKARPFDPNWVRGIIAQAHAGEQCGRTPSIFVKQMGSLCKAGEFQTFQHWVNKAQSWIGGTGALCFDTKMRPMRIGGDMAMAEREGTFPVSFYLPLADRKGGDMDEWPVDLRVREFPPCPSS